MSKVDLPKEVKPFWELFENLAYRWDYSTVFDDYLTYCMNAFLHPKCKAETDCFQKYSQAERDQFWKLLEAMIRIYEKQMACNGWYDMLGTIYEEIASHHKVSGMGQFFTPSGIVNLMAEITLPSEKMTGKTIADQTCGSGRNLLGAHALQPGNYLYGVDLDKMCCKMSCINMVIHECVGEVVHGNILSMQFYGAWHINPKLWETGVWYIISIPQDFCHQMPTEKTEQEKQEMHQEMEMRQAVDQIMEFIQTLNPEEQAAREQAEQASRERAMERLSQRFLFTDLPAKREDVPKKTQERKGKSEANPDTQQTQIEPGTQLDIFRGAQLKLF